MEKKSVSNFVLVFACGLCALGCANKKPKPEVASSAGSSDYAVKYPASLNAALTRYTEQTAKAKENNTAFAGYKDKLNGADPETVVLIYKEADETGRGRDYANKTAETLAVRAFFDREKEDLTRRINGSVTAAKEKAECQCELDTYGTVSYALKDAVDKRLEKSLQETGECTRLTALHEKEIGKKNIEIVSTQADAISWTAHVVFVSLPSLYEDMARMLSESKRITKTLERELEAEKIREADPSTSKGEKKAINKRIQELEDAKNAVDIFVNEADRLVSKADTEIPAIRAEYEKAFNNLLKSLKSETK